MAVLPSRAQARRGVGGGSVLGVENWLSDLAPGLVYLVVAVIILLESMGVPLPGEVTLVSASLLAAAGVVNIWGVAVAAATGAIIGDSIGYAIGHRGGRALLERFGRRYPNHFGPTHLARAERVFQRYGVWAVFFGRFVALLRILAGPLAGALRVPYRAFLLANASGGIVWAFGTALVVYSVGLAAQEWLHDFSWVALVVVVLFGVGTTLYLRWRATRAEASVEMDQEPSPLDEIAAVTVDTAHDLTDAVTHPQPDDSGEHRPDPDAPGEVPRDHSPRDHSPRDHGPRDHELRDVKHR